MSNFVSNVENDAKRTLFTTNEMDSTKLRQIDQLKKIMKNLHLFGNYNTKSGQINAPDSFQLQIESFLTLKW